MGHTLTSVARLVPACSFRGLVSALAAAIAGCVALALPVLMVGYGTDRIAGAFLACGLLVALLVLPMAPMAAGHVIRAVMGISQSDATIAGLALWLTGSTVAWWFAPVVLTGPPSFYGLAMGVIPVALTFALTVWILRRRHSVNH